MSFYGAAAHYIAQLRNNPDPEATTPPIGGTGTWNDDLWCECGWHRIQRVGDKCPTCADEERLNPDCPPDCPDCSDDRKASQ